MPTPTNSPHHAGVMGELSDADLNRAIAEARGWTLELRLCDDGYWYRMQHPCEADGHTRWFKPTKDGAWNESPQWSVDWQAAFGDLLPELVAAGLKPGLDYDFDTVEIGIWPPSKDIRSVVTVETGDPLKAAARAISEAWKSAYDAGLLQPK